MARCVRAVVFWTASGLAFAPLRASFRPRLAASVISPLRFANPSPPSGWVEDLHLLAIERARHTTKRLRLFVGAFENLNLNFRVLRTDKSRRPNAIDAPSHHGFDPYHHYDIEYSTILLGVS